MIKKNSNSQIIQGYSAKNQQQVMPIHLNVISYFSTITILFMNIQKTSNNQVQICKNDLCINAEGKYAEAISKAIIVMMLLYGAAALIKAIR